MRLIFFSITFFIFYNPLVFAEKNDKVSEIKKLKSLLAKEESDTARSIICANIGYLFFEINPDSSFYYGKKGLSIAEDLNFSYGIEKNLVVIGLYYMNIGLHSTALEKAYIALEHSLTRPANFADHSDCYNLIGMIYNNNKDYDEAVEYYYKSLESGEKAEKYIKVCRAHNNLANSFIQTTQYDSAIFHLNESLSLNKITQNQSMKAFNYSNLGEVNLFLGNYDKAINYINQAIEINNEINNPRLRSNNYKVLANIYLKSGQINKAILWAKKTINNAKSANSYKEEVDGLLILHEAFKAKNDYKNALKYLDKADSLRFSINQSEIAAGIEVLQKDFELKEKKNEILLLEKENELKNRRLTYSQKQVRLQWYIIFMALIIFVLIGYLFYVARNRYKTKVKYIAELKKKNKLIRQQTKELNSLNQNLEKRVAERTRELEAKNEQLKEYAFINSHKLRAPVATILGLIHLLNKNMINAFEEKEYNCRLKKALDELDKVIREITITLEK
ncbi:tetratricopeptide repeat protein [Mangrovivirga sp. M17]|uniref:Tetratricopeptide repeat protein n=1 Tax=Mangrovivirga halotolerans TaxID=2993936 RepID=A0ABT3RLN3_9BACT|nr:tetratricopeptide repeat protein [Mangrovivirga halotolerans]MCX2742527.1 tetratricopeptide repeat protein [Mangrovivirga halotolerans]